MEEVLLPSDPDRIESYTLLEELAKYLEAARTGLAAEGRR